jgi:hypothetical protein
MKFTKINNSIHMDIFILLCIIYKILKYFIQQKCNLALNSMIKHKIISIAYLKNLQIIDNIFNNLLRGHNHQNNNHQLYLLHHHSIKFQSADY